MLKFIIAIIIGYFMGCIQSAYIIGRMKGLDIREHGSHNAGASNAFITMGWKYGVLVGLIDILKAAIPVFLIKTFLPDSTLLAFVCGVAVMIGHIFPVFMGFRGGKGTACIVGITLGLNPILFAVAAVVIIAVTIISDYVAIGTLVMLIAISVALFFLSYGYIILFISLGIMALSIYKHMENFIRIYKGQEKGLRKVISNND